MSDPLELKAKTTIVNGSKVTKENWHRVIAVSDRPCSGVYGVPAIDAATAKNGVYYEKWELKHEGPDEFSAGGFIFREVNHGGGINGRRKTFKEAIRRAAASDHIRIYLRST